jgi:hypothetical protein
MTFEVAVTHFSLPVFETVFLSQVHCNILQILSVYIGCSSILNKSFSQITLQLQFPIYSHSLSEALIYFLSVV